MRIVVLGGGAREHALSARLGAEPGVSVLCAPGNPGIARNLPVAPVAATDPAAVLDLATAWGADLTVVGPEAPLAAGVADRFLSAGRPLFGPTRAAARLETSKAFAKDLMARAGLPTARARVCDALDEAIATVRAGDLGWPVVVKADGLAGGKGVVIAGDEAAAESALRAAMVDGAFGTAGTRVVLEECLVGEELSYFVIADGERFVACGSAQDHKRLLDGDQGPNTGGMGAFAPSVLLTDALADRIEREVVRPVLSAMAGAGTPFRGFLYCGLMLTADGPKVIEFNCRFGDPEAQVVLPLLDEPLSALLLAASTGAPLPARARFSSDVAAGVVLASAGYPGDSSQGHLISGLDMLATECPAAAVRFAGVAERDGALVTNGGRVLTVVGRGPTYRAAIDAAYDAARRVSFQGVQYRTDIGRRALAQRTSPSQS
jgi:phosphoribosylamine--glycine ligase